MNALALLNDGSRMPLIGLGVHGIAAGGACSRSVAHALSVGYRHVDTARFYGNEEDVGRAVRESGIQRDQIFVVTKLWDSDQGYDSALKACDGSLAKLGLGHIDLYLIHWPIPGKRLDSWRALVELRKQGKCRSIGVSNFTILHLEELMAASEVIPAVNQVEFSPFLYQCELLEFCRSKGIQLEAYGSLTRGAKFGHPLLVKIARKYAKTPAQILLRWAVQHDVVVIPKSGQPARIEENADIFGFTISDEDMAALNGLDAGFHTSRDPAAVK